MKRTINEIQSSILERKDQTSSLGALEVLTTDEKQTLDNLNSNSKAAIWRLWVYIISFAIWIHEGIFETHKREIEELIALNKVHTRKWYRGKALLFQFGFDLGESDVYDNEGVDESAVIASKIVKQASVEELAGRLKIKVAKNVPSVNDLLDNEFDLAPLTDAEKAAFGQYMNLIKDAGTRLEIISRPPDVLKMEIDIYFDPLVFDGLGQRLDGSDNFPIKRAIEDFLYNLDFNGELVLTKLTDHLQGVEGVEMPVIKSAAAKYAENDYIDINETYIADSGYMILSEDFDEELDEFGQIISQVPQTVINYIPREI
jgi:hypothetical protein